MARATSQGAGGASGGTRFRPPAALPPLRGRWLAAYTILWLLLLPLAVAVPVYSLATELSKDTIAYWTPLGLLTNSNGPEIRIRDVVSEEARAAGIRRGDAVVRIDGKPVPGRAVPGSAARHQTQSILLQPEGTIFEVVTRSSDGTLRTSRLTRRLAHMDERFAGTGLTARLIFVGGVISAFVPTVGIVPVALLLFRRRRDTTAALLSLSLLLISATSLISAAMWLDSGLYVLGQALAGAGWSGFVIALLVFPNGRFEPRWTFWAMLPVLALGPLVIFLPLSNEQQNVAITALLAIGVAALALRYRRLPPGMERQQLRWSLFGFAAGVTLIAAGTAITTLPALLAGVNYGLVGWLNLLAFAFFALGPIFFCAGLLVSLLRYRLYDIDTVISRSAGYAVLSVLLGATFAASAKGLETVFELFFGREAGALPGVIGAGLAVALITPLHNRIHGWAERRFQKALAHLRRDLPECVDDLRETAGLTELLDETLARISTGVGAIRATALIGDEAVATREVTAEEVHAWQRDFVPDAPAGGLGCEPSDPLFPMRLPLRVRHGGSAPIGWILLGPRPDGTFYGKDERDALAEIANPIARALRIVMLRESRQREQETRFEALEKKLAALSRRRATRPGSRSTRPDRVTGADG